MEKKSLQTEISTKETINKENLMEKGATNGSREGTMKEISCRVCDKVEANGLIRMGQFMKVNMFLT